MKVPNRDSQKILDIYLNPTQKDRVPENSTTNPAQVGTDEGSDEEDFQPSQMEEEAPPPAQQPSDSGKKSLESTSAPQNKQPRQESFSMQRPPERKPQPSTSTAFDPQFRHDRPRPPITYPRRFQTYLQFS